jgi:hypothetical protein
MDDDTERPPAPDDAELPAGTEIDEVVEDPAATDPAGFTPIAAPIYVAPMPPVPVRRRQHDFTPIVIALAAVLVLGAGFTVTVLGESSAHRSGPQAQPTTSLRSSPAPRPSADMARSGPLPLAASAPAIDPLEVSQADGMNAVLRESAGTFTEVNTAINQVSQCTDVETAAAGIAGAAQARGDQAGEAQALDVSALPEGSELQSLLVQSLQASQASDTEYAQWASQGTTGTDGIPTCTPGAPPAPSQEDEQAGTLKGQFSALWTPLASRLDITTPSDY